jgi:hypothetical protein
MRGFSQTPGTHSLAQAGRTPIGPIGPISNLPSALGRYRFALGKVA